MALTNIAKVYVNGIIKKGADMKYWDFYECPHKTKFDDNDLIEYFVSQLNVKLESDKNEDKIISKLLIALRKVLINGDTKKFKTEIVNSATGFKEKYKNYLENNGFEANAEIEESIKKLGDSIVNGILPDTEDDFKISDNDIEVEQTTVDSSEIIALKEEIEAKIKEINELTNDCTKKDKTIVKSNKKVEEVKDKLAEQRKLVKELNSKLGDYTSKIKELEKEIKTKDITLENQTSATEALNKQIVSLGNSLSKVQEDYFNQSKMLDEYKSDESKRVSNVILKDALIDLLFNGEYTLELLIDALKKNGLFYSESEVFNMLMEISKEYSIYKNGVRSYPIVYKINKPKLESNRSFNITTSSNSKLELLFVSDLHIEDIDASLSKLDRTYDYASKNDINLIINLGDLTNVGVGDNLDQKRHIIDDIIEKLPKENGIYHAVLGGNHDKTWENIGIDVIKYISQNREDIIDLGYSHAFLDFNQDKKDSIALHHFNNKFSITDAYGRTKTNMETLNTAFTSYYAPIPDRNREDIYIDMMGHFHKSSLDNLNAACCVPSLLKDRFANGAWHGTIYFDSNGRIAEMLFRPLVFNTTKLVSTTEIEYKKLTLK